MENKIVYLKTYIITIVVLVILFIVALGGTVYYYEQKIKNLQGSEKGIKNNQTGITIVENLDTSVDNVRAE